MGFLMAALPIISAGMQIMQGVAGYNAAKGQAAVAKMEGSQAVAVSQEEAFRQREQTRFQLGAIRAQVGAQGSTFEGSPMTSYLESVKQGELQAQDILYRGTLTKQAKGYEADIYKRQGLMKLIGGTVGGITSLGSSLIGGFGAGAGASGSGAVAPGTLGTFETGSVGYWGS